MQNLSARQCGANGCSGQRRQQHSGDHPQPAAAQQWRQMLLRSCRQRQMQRCAMAAAAAMLKWQCQMQNKCNKIAAKWCGPNAAARRLLTQQMRHANVDGAAAATASGGNAASIQQPPAAAAATSGSNANAKSTAAHGNGKCNGNAAMRQQQQ